MMLHTSPLREEHQMQQLEQPRWRPSRRQVLWTLAIVAVLTVAVLIGYRYDITLWDWIKLLIVPAAIAGAGLWFNKQQRERELQIADQRAQTDRDIADQRRQDEALQAYLSQIGELLLREERPLHETEKCDVVRTLAWARTKTVLRRLHDGAHKGRVLRFLGEAGLLNKPAPVIDLKGADLREADLRGSVLEEVCLKEADLRGGNLRGAVLGEPDLSGGNLLPYDKQNPDHWSRYSLKNIESGKEDFRARGLTI